MMNKRNKMCVVAIVSMFLFMSVGVFTATALEDSNEMVEEKTVENNEKDLNVASSLKSPYFTDVKFTIIGNTVSAKWTAVCPQGLALNVNYRKSASNSWDLANRYYTPSPAEISASWTYLLPGTYTIDYYCFTTSTSSDTYHKTIRVPAFESTELANNPLVRFLNQFPSLARMLQQLTTAIPFYRF